MKGLKKYFHSRINAITLLLEKPAISFTTATFHTIRLEIKKLNSFFELVEYCSKDFNRNKASKPFRKIFHQAGKIREIQIEELLLKKYINNTFLVGYLKNLRIEKNKERAIFSKLLSESVTEQIKKSSIHTLQVLSAIDKKKVSHYLKEKRKKILSHTGTSDIQPEQVHQLRKLLKCYYYNKKLIEKGIQNTISDKQSQLSDLLGKWHDLQITYLHLNKAIKAEGIDPVDITQIETVEALISSEIQIKLSQIKTVLSGFRFIEVN